MLWNFLGALARRLGWAPSADVVHGSEDQLEQHCARSRSRSRSREKQERADEDTTPKDGRTTPRPLAEGRPKAAAEDEEAPKPSFQGSPAAAPGAPAPTAPAAPAAAAPPMSDALDVPLVVSGGQNQTIREIVRGTYFRSGSNHGKPVYKKKREVIEDDDDDLDVLIYFWDERDGDENCGWWFSPSIGGDMVWAYHPSRKAAMPPSAAWNVPHDGAIDSSFSVTPQRSAEARSRNKAKKEEPSSAPRESSRSRSRQKQETAEKRQTMLQDGRTKTLKGNVKAKESAPASAASSASAASAASAAAQANPLDVPLVVSGGQNQTIREIVRGTYFRSGSNHGKPVYKKKREVIEDDDDDLDVLIYFWDERDGDENCGWWFSPSIGGDMVWAYHPSRKALTPPPAAWNVPHDMPIDVTFSVTPAADTRA
ncbi:unnamed protein product [Durusdinium trenchii]|uniref:Uncharacterized protein n=2 Tax=Durusdinium trenchii TaxID=1381693 RepID=A0ABP0RMR1_9DINO